MNELTKWVNSVIALANRPKFTQQNMRKIIGLHGPLQSGKNTAADALTSLGFKQVAFADALREQLFMANPIIASSGDWQVRVRDVVMEHGWDYSKTTYPEVRRLLQVLGTEGNREIHGQDCWVNIIERYFKEEPSTNFVVTDVRFPNEIDVIHKNGGKVIRLVKEGREPSDTHLSEQLLTNCDYVIENNGTIEELHKQVLDTVGMV